MEEIKNSKDCPYIGTINRYMLDFDLKKVCSISLSTLNIYCCLICGKYFQGRGKSTYAYSHSLEESHHLFVNLKTEHIVCLPDGYLINDASLNDIKSNLNPVYSIKDIESLDTMSEYSQSLDGKEYLPGCLGLNNVKGTDHINAILQSLCRMKKLRNYFLTYNNINYDVNDLIEVFIVRLSELFKKMFNKNSFKEHISPHELLHAISSAFQMHFQEKVPVKPKLQTNHSKEDKKSKGKSITQAKIIKDKDPIFFLSWILNTLKKTLSKHKTTNIIEQYFMGKLQIDIYTIIKDYNDLNHTNNLLPKSKIVKIDGIDYFHETKTQEFLYLSLNLPLAPLFKDSTEQINIPQISIYELMKKFNGEKYIEDPVKGQKMRYKLLSLPKYLILIFNRFGTNRFFKEKNPTIVNFPLEDFTINDCSYDLNANIIHDGKPNEGSYRVQVLYEGRNEWYEIQDLNVDKIMPQSVLVSESYIHFYTMKSEKEKCHTINDRD